MKRWLLVIMLSLAVLLGAGCQRESPDHELMVFAAASLTETLTELGKAFEEENPGTKVLFSFDSSGTLRMQLAEGAKADIFISASKKPMDELDGSAVSGADPQGLNLIQAGTRVDLLENWVVLAVPEGNPASLGSFQDLARGLEKGDLVLAMGNSDVPVGQYTLDILRFFHLDEAALARQGSITYGSDVKEVTAQVKEGAVDCGIIYSTDAAAAGLITVAEADEAMVGRVIYPVAVLKDARDPSAAGAFLAFLQSEQARAVFKGAGFTPLP